MSRSFIRDFRKGIKNDGLRFSLFLFGCLMLIPVIVLVNAIVRFFDDFTEWLIEKHGFAIILFVIALLILILIASE